jgi:hypothetical protein
MAQNNNATGRILSNFPNIKGLLGLELNEHAINALNHYTKYNENKKIKNSKKHTGGWIFLPVLVEGTCPFFGASA